MQPHDIDDAADHALEAHVEHLIDTLLKAHNPFCSKEANDEALRRFEIGLKHTLGVQRLIEDVIARVLTEREPGA